ncbi:MAG TPA: RlmE family RNA methyltransferase [Burkholderiales bacterium]|nr:RlmE family RNA methyltransferase [Burkholderiales bacterium]
MARSKTSKAWMREHVSDAYVQRARREGYRSRAAYKLQEIARSDRLMARGMTVVDLGAAPGGWSQVAAELVGPTGKVVAVDLLEMVALRSVVLIQGDFQEVGTLERLEGELHGAPVDLVLSDMAPNISGIGISDQARSMHLAELALDFAVKCLKPDGNLLVKTFQGVAFGELREALRPHFRQVLTRKPYASRGRSSEVYLLGKGLIRQA